MNDGQTPTGVDPSAVLLALLALGVGHGAVVGLLAGSLVLPNPVNMLRRGPPPARFGLEPVPVELSDSTRAWYFPHPSATHAVLVCHGRSRSKRWMLPLIAELCPKYAVLAVDFPGHGENPYRTTSLGPREAGTVRAGLNWLVEQGHADLLVYGVSMGGAAAVLALGAGGADEVRGLVTDGAFDRVATVVDHAVRWLPVPRYLRRLGIGGARRVVGVERPTRDPVDAAAHIEVPCLFAHGDRDWLVPPTCAQKLAEAAPNGRWVLYPGRHDQPRNVAMQRIVLEFFDGFGSGAPPASEAPSSRVHG